MRREKENVGNFVDDEQFDRLGVPVPLRRFAPPELFKTIRTAVGREKYKDISEGLECGLHLRVIPDALLEKVGEGLSWLADSLDGNTSKEWKVKWTKYWIDNITGPYHEALKNLRNMWREQKRAMSPPEASF